MSERYGQYSGRDLETLQKNFKKCQEKNDSLGSAIILEQLAKQVKEDHKQASTVLSELIRPDSAYHFTEGPSLTAELLLKQSRELHERHLNPKTTEFRRGIQLAKDDSER